ncbi:MAG: glutamine synthetase [Acidimicrobiia bacterium]|nr:MAG: glutamine synthetase [Acidimicrobiia bacterium]
MARGMLTVEELDDAVAAGTIDTVLVVFPDLQGRLMGKRVTGRYWVDHMASGRAPIHACNYLLAVDVDMTPLPGYRFANWEQGYGDVALQPDLVTLRRIPWLEGTALVVCDVLDEHTGAPVEVSPRRILQRQVERAAAAGYTVMFGSELEFFLFRESPEEAAAKGYSGLTPHSDVIEDYHVLQTTRDEYLVRAIRNGVDGAGIPVEFSKGEAGRGQHEINLVYSTPVEMADRHVIYKNAAKEIASQHGRSVTFMAKYSPDEVGSSCHIHSSLWDADGTTSLTWDADAPDHLTPVFRAWLAGQVECGRELAWMYAPTVNSYKRYQPESWAPTALAWSVDNRTCGFRLVGRGPSFRLESRIPGADVNPYLAFAATIAAGLHGIEHGAEPPPRFDGNAYAADGLVRVPTHLLEAIEAFERSKVAVDAFGEEVHEHLLNTARQEWLAFTRAVTDWERRRNFDQW